MSTQITASPAPLLVDTPTAAKMLGISPRTIWSLTATRQLLAVRIGRSVRYSIDDLHSFVNRRKGGSDDNTR
jgi:excisionase family DNA binding protein